MWLLFKIFILFTNIDIPLDYPITILGEEKLEVILKDLLNGTLCEVCQKPYASYCYNNDKTRLISYRCIVGALENELLLLKAEDLPFEDYHPTDK